MEAMAHGLCILACNSGGSLETIQHDYTGCLLAANSQIWGQKLKELIEDQEQLRQMQENAKERIKNLFSITVFADSL